MISYNGDALVGVRLSVCLRLGSEADAEAVDVTF